MNTAQSNDAFIAALVKLNISLASLSDETAAQLLAVWNAARSVQDHQAISILVDLLKTDLRPTQARSVKDALTAMGHKAPVCKCSMRLKLVGDGCEVCNPDYASALAKEQA